MDLDDITERELIARLNRTFGNKNEDLKLIARLTLLDDGSEEMKERIDVAVKKLQNRNKKIQEEMDKIFENTLDESGNIVPIKKSTESQVQEEVVDLSLNNVVS